MSAITFDDEAAWNGDFLVFWAPRGTAYPMPSEATGDQRASRLQGSVKPDDRGQEAGDRRTAEAVRSAGNSKKQFQPRRGYPAARAALTQLHPRQDARDRNPQNGSSGFAQAATNRAIICARSAPLRCVVRWDQSEAPACGSGSRDLAPPIFCWGFTRPVLEMAHRSKQSQNILCVELNPLHVELGGHGQDGGAD
jgi:hypothetical protein